MMKIKFKKKKKNASIKINKKKKIIYDMHSSFLFLKNIIEFIQIDRDANLREREREKYGRFLRYIKIFLLLLLLIKLN